MTRDFRLSGFGVVNVWSGRVWSMLSVEVSGTYGETLEF